MTILAIWIFIVFCLSGGCSTFRQLMILYGVTLGIPLVFGVWLIT